MTFLSVTLSGQRCRARALTVNGDERSQHMLTSRKAMLAVGVIASIALAGCSSGGDDKPIVGLITKTDTNPFFVKMKEGAQQAAGAQGVTLQTFAGKQDGDNESQVQAIENLISAG